MSKHVSISPEEAADRLAIRELIEAYAHCADRRDAEGQMALSATDTHFVVYMNAKDPKPSQELHSREALAHAAHGGSRLRSSPGSRRGGSASDPGFQHHIDLFTTFLSGTPPAN